VHPQAVAAGPEGLWRRADVDDAHVNVEGFVDFDLVLPGLDRDDERLGAGGDHLALGVEQQADASVRG
jgi:hypothetical protein